MIYKLNIIASETYGMCKVVYPTEKPPIPIRKGLTAKPINQSTIPYIPQTHFMGHPIIGFKYTNKLLTLIQKSDRKNARKTLASAMHIKQNERMNIMEILSAEDPREINTSDNTNSAIHKVKNPKELLAYARVIKQYNHDHRPTILDQYKKPKWRLVFKNGKIHVVYTNPTTRTGWVRQPRYYDQMTMVQSYAEPKPIHTETYYRSEGIHTHENKPLYNPDLTPMEQNDNPLGRSQYLRDTYRRSPDEQESCPPTWRIDNVADVHKQNYYTVIDELHQLYRAIIAIHWNGEQ